ncbi:MAG TPA: hypothetical protein VMH83_15050 [Candidatus Acidoferrum sp.]|nr:hypothetical protein [Candidatus Acidoferrum sp.]
MAASDIGNRCGHDRASLRAVDVVRRGKGGHPQLLGVISAYLAHGVRNIEQRKLRALDKLNDSGRRKRSEQIEAVFAVCGFLVAHWFQPDTRRCAMTNGHFLEVPDAQYIASRISRTAEWQSRGELSLARVYAALQNLDDAGYIKKSKQMREQLPTGEWISRPRLIAFTKQFFLDLGGLRLWRSVWAKGKRLVQDLRSHLVERDDDAPGETLAKYFNPGRLLSPRQAFAWRRKHGDPPPVHLEIQRARLMRAQGIDLPDIDAGLA